MNNLNLTVIILSYNTKEITHKCLEKLKISKDYCEKRFKNKIQVIVLDNNSSDSSPQMIKSEFPWVKLIISKENTGFSRGNNLSLKQAKNPFILLLNSDVYLEEDSLSKAIAYFRVNLNCDVLGPRLNYSTGKLQPSAGLLPDPLNIISWIFGFKGFHSEGKNYFSKAHKVGWIMGAFFMFRRKVYAATGGFDENFFMHMEEIEWCKRIKDKGFKVWFVPQFTVVHLHGASTNFDLSAGFLNELKGIKYYLLKHYNSVYWPVKFFLMLGLIMRVLAFSVLRKPKRAKIYMEGLKVV